MYAAFIVAVLLLARPSANLILDASACKGLPRDETFEDARSGWPSDLLVCLCGIFQLQAGDERVSPRAFINRIPNEPTIAIGGALAFGQAGFAAFIGILIFDGIDVELKAADVR